MWPNRNHLIIVLMILLFAVITILLVVKEFNYGPYFDDVYRINNFMPLLNQNADTYEDQTISSITIGGRVIPLMYKLYISSVSILPFLPIGLFENPFMGLQVVKGLYFFAAMLIIFWLMAKYNLKFAAILSLMVVTSPLFFVKLIAPFHLILIPIAAWLLYLHFAKNKSNWYFFGGMFLLALCLNLKFYSAWVLASLFLSSIMFFPKQWKESIGSFKKILLTFFAVGIGAFNYIFYNIKENFPSLQPLFDKLFNIENYQPIDLRVPKPFWVEIREQFDLIAGFLNLKGTNTTILFIAINLFILLLLVLSICKILQQKKFKEYKYYFFPLVNFFLILTFILITPNSTRAYHFTFLMPFYGLSIIFSVVLFYRNYKNLHLGRKFVYLVPSMFIALNIANSSALVLNIPPPDRFHTKAIYELNDYLKENHIDSANVLHTEWGLYSQLYFLNKGEYQINSIVFDIIGKKSYQDKYEALKNALINISNQRNQPLYLPVYKLRPDLQEEMTAYNGDLYASTKVQFAQNNLDIHRALADIAKEFSLDLQEEKIFYDEQRGYIKIITLYKIPTMDWLMVDEMQKKNDEKSFIDFSVSDYPYTRGLYEYEDGFRWSSSHSTIFLKYNGEKYLSMQIYIPDINVYKDDCLNLSVSIGTEASYQSVITKPGINIINFEIQKNYRPENNYVAVNIEASPNEDKGIDTRDLSFVLRIIGFREDELN